MVPSIVASIPIFRCIIPQVTSLCTPYQYIPLQNHSPLRIFPQPMRVVSYLSPYNSSLPAPCINVLRPPVFLLYFFYIHVPPSELIPPSEFKAGV